MLPVGNYPIAEKIDNSKSPLVGSLVRKYKQVTSPLSETNRDILIEMAKTLC